jgi:hypothetical protein
MAFKTIKWVKMLKILRGAIGLKIKELKMPNKINH